MADMVFLTSGSTGEAKEIHRKESALQADARALTRCFSAIWSSRPFVVSTAAPGHIFGYFWNHLVPSIVGSEVFPGKPISVEELNAACGSHSNVLFVTTPSFLEKALVHPLFATLSGRITAVVTSGSPLRKTTAFSIKQILGFCPLEIYGSTEAGTVAWRRQDNDEEWSVFDQVSVSTDGESRLVIQSPFAMESPMTMSDLVRLVTPNRFLLLGRADRRVKILEEFVSLNAVEQAFSTHPLVERARAESFGEGVKRIGVLLVPSEKGRAALASGTFGGICRRLRGDLLADVTPIAFPRRIRFVRELPVDERGKTTVADAEAALSAWCQEPVVLNWLATADALTTRIVFPPDCECFSGHFPKQPILPGVAQLFFLRHFARQAFPDFPDTGTWRRLKFHKLIKPGDEILLKIWRHAYNSFEFSSTNGDDTCMSGMLEGDEA